MQRKFLPVFPSFEIFEVSWKDAPVFKNIATRNLSENKCFR